MVVSTSCRCCHSQRLFLFFAALAFSLLHGATAQHTYATSAQPLQRLQDPNVIITNSNGTTVVYSPLTGDVIPQGLASDGSGSGFSLPAMLWITFSFTFGMPLMLVGFRGWRLTTGTAIGVSITLASWSVFVNTLDNVGISDIILTVLVLSLFGLGFLFGLLEVGRIAGILQLGIQGGLAIGIRIVLLRTGLLVPQSTVFFVNWLLVALCGIACAILVVCRQRAGLLLGSASVGTFLCALGIDLVINKQSGMSRGLRYLIDRNRYHVVDTINNGYLPPTSTFIIIGLSLALTPAFAYAQHKLFKGHFCPFHYDDVESQKEFPVDEEPKDKLSGKESPATTRDTPLPTTPISVTSPLKPLDIDQRPPVPVAPKASSDDIDEAKPSWL